MEGEMGRFEVGAGENKEGSTRLQKLQEQVSTLRQQLHSHMDAWQKTEMARHAQRPYTLDYIERIFTDWSEIHGDRFFGDDPALICGIARFHGKEVVVLGHQKGRDIKTRVYRNFGQANPEGYRKSLRVMKFAEKFNRPIFTFIDTPGAYPGLGAEERGQAEAIARSLREMARLKVPIITTITGEAGSGGALAIAVADRILMLENTVYSVISPQGCASIMWRDSTKRDVAAQPLPITPKDLMQLGCVDENVPEPAGGAHTDHDAAAKLVLQALQKHFDELKKLPAQQLVENRYKKFRKMAQFFSED